MGYVEYHHFWDNGVEGNYWSNYTGTDLNYDGIGDAAHVVYSRYGYTDNYPLMGPFFSFTTSLEKHVNVISNSTISSFQYVDLTNAISLLVSNSSTDQTFGFVRICIPYALMNETHHVTVNGTEPYYVNYDLAENGTHR